MLLAYFVERRLSSRWVECNIEFLRRPSGMAVPCHHFHMVGPAQSWGDYPSDMSGLSIDCHSLWSYFQGVGDRIILRIEGRNGIRK